MRKASDFFYLAKLTQSALTPSSSCFADTVALHPYKAQLDTIYSRIQKSAESGETKMYARNVPVPICDHLKCNGFALDTVTISWECSKCECSGTK